MKITSIKDPIHGYIDLNETEREVVDSRWFQRLRRVRQNDVGSIVYPSMLTTRFEHSLGAMHLAGVCIDAALRDEETTDHVARFLNALRGEITAIAGPIVPEDTAKYMRFVRQCARMYGALHDIGHPPYSHLLETCIRAADLGNPDLGANWHESNGEEIVRDHLPKEVAGPDTKAVLSVVAHLSSKTVKSPALRALKLLVDAVVDVDRMDFVLRDGRNSGSDFGIYDVDRLANSFRVHTQDVFGRTEILIRPLRKALSAIESLIQERYKIYRWVLYHHRIVQSRELVRYVLSHTSADPSFSPKQFRAENYVTAPQESTFSYVLLGDAVVDRHLENHFKRISAKSPGGLSTTERRLLTSLRILLLRADLGTPLWKQGDTYNGTRVDHADDAASFEVHLEKALRPANPPRVRILEVYGSFANWIAATFGGKGKRHLDEVVDKLNSGKSEEWYLLSAPGLKTAGDDRVLTKTDLGFKAENLSDISSIARAMELVRRDDVQMFGFVFCDNGTCGKEGTLANEGRKRVAGAIAEHYARPEVKLEIDSVFS